MAGGVDYVAIVSRTFEDDPDIPSCPRPDTAGSWMPRGWKYAVGTVDKRGFASMARFRAISQAAQSTLTHSSGSLAQLRRWRYCAGGPIGSCLLAGMLGGDLLKIDLIPKLLQSATLSTARQMGSLSHSL
jgi:hypothetical protein